MAWVIDLAYHEAAYQNQLLLFLGKPCVTDHFRGIAFLLVEKGHF